MEPNLPRFLLEAADRSPEAAIAAVRRAGGTPLRTADHALFVYVDDADSVRLRHWMDTFPALPAFERHADSGVWTLPVSLPERSRIEYKIAVRSGEHRRVILDPLNPRRARDPFGSNSVVTGPGYRRPDWSKPSPNVESGTIEALPIESKTLGQRRGARLYLPARSAPAQMPLLVAHDGSEYVEYAALAVVLDNLIARGDIPPVACLLTDPGRRNSEYTGDERHVRYLTDELIPTAEARLPIDRERIVGLGASFGAVAALHAAWRRPGTFSGLILQSGSFVTALGGRHRRGSVFAPVVSFMESFAADPGRLPARVHLSCGRFDGLAADNRRMAARLDAFGLDVVYDEAPDGHNWENWRDRLRSGLLHVLAR